jgi:hypothetical protein
MALFFIIGISQAQDRGSDFPVLKGPYLGQKPPDMTPEIFAPGIVSTGMREFASVFSSDHTQFYYTNSSAPFATILFMEKRDNRWAPPRVAPFSGRYRDLDMMFSYDNSRLYFCSNRPIHNSAGLNQNMDIWYVEKADNEWSPPVHLGDINSEANEYYPCLTESGTLYFTSDRKGGMGRGDIYRCRSVNGEFKSPENLGEPINSPLPEGDLYIAPDESYIIVTCYGRSDGLGSGDLYISFRKKDGSWAELRNMGAAINSYANEHCPVVTFDGKYFFFTSYRSKINIPPDSPLTFADIIKMQESPGNGTGGDIYWVDAKIIEKLKPKE